MMKDTPRITIDFAIVEGYIRKDESLNRFLQYVASEKAKGYSSIAIEDIERSLLTDSRIDYIPPTHDDLTDALGYTE